MLALAGTAAPACSGDAARHSDHAGKAATSMRIPHGSMRVAAGYRWDFARSAHLVAEGAFRLPVDMGVATVFADMNGNGRLDRFVEPSSPCEGPPWRCSLEPTRLMLHRVQRTSADGSVADKTMLVAEAFDPHSGAIDREAALCDAQGVCAQRTRGPYEAAEQGLVLALCGMTEASPATERVVFESAATGRVELEVEQPPALHVTTDWTRGKDGSLEAVARANRPVERTMAWVGRYAGDRLLEIIWTSEDEPSSIEVAGGEARLRIPAAYSATCTSNAERCSVTWQLASRVPGRAVPTYTEADVIKELL